MLKINLNNALEFRGIKVNKVTVLNLEIIGFADIVEVYIHRCAQIFTNEIM